MTFSRPSRASTRKGTLFVKVDFAAEEWRGAKGKYVSDWHGRVMVYDS